MSFDKCFGAGSCADVNMLMMIARNYLMAHYPTDVLAAAIIGVASGFISYYITYFIFQFLYINRKKKWCGLVLNWSAPDYYGIPSRLKLTGEADEKEFAFLRKSSSEGKTDPGAPEGEPPKEKKWKLPGISLSLPGKNKGSGYQGKHSK